MALAVRVVALVQVVRVDAVSAEVGSPLLVYAQRLEYLRGGGHWGAAPVGDGSVG